MNKNDTAVFRDDSENFFEQSLAGFLIADAQNNITKSNARFAGWLESNAADLEGKRFSDLLSVGSKIYYETHLSPLLRMQGFFEEVLLDLRALSGKRLKVLVNAVEHKNSEKITQSIYYTITKATDRIQYEQNLQHAKNEAEKGLESEKRNVVLREQLIAVLGHDLRNPLGAITMAVGLLEESLPDATHTRILAIIKRSSHRMAELITNIMDFARTRLGEGILISSQDVVLEPVLKQVVEEMKLIFPKREIIAVFDIKEPVTCDADRIAQLVSNLLANALTHGATDKPVYVHAANTNNKLELSVTNSGEAIPASLHKLLFEPFTREGNRPSKNGIGLGLYISAEIARAHKAALTFTSTEAETKFSFNMPL